MATPLALRAFEYWLTRYRRTWFSGLVVSFATPTLFLLALGLGLGPLVDDDATTLGGVRYAAFIAPGLLAAAALQTGASEGSWPVLGALKWQRTYIAMLGTPLRPVDVMLGHLAWIATRIAVSAAAFFAVMLAFGVVDSPVAVLAVPAALLTGVAVAAPVMAYVVSLEQDEPLALIWRLGVMPMFLLSGTFFPIEQLPYGMRLLAYATPLWHGADLCRDLVLGDASLGSSLLHVAYLSALFAVGLVAGARSYRKRLSS